MIDISSDTLNIYDVNLIHQVGHDIITYRAENLYYFDGFHWIKFFSIGDLDPYYVTGFLACGGKSINEFMFTGSTSGFPLLLKDNKWTWEKIIIGGHMVPNIIYYDDSIYFMAMNDYVNLSFLFKGKLKQLFPPSQAVLVKEFDL